MPLAIRERVAGALSLAARYVSPSRHPDEQRVNRSPRTIAGISVDPDSAVKLSTCWAATRYLSQTVGQLPWHCMQPIDAGSEVAKKNPVDWILYARPNPEWSSFQFRETLVHWALRWGNGYAEIERDAINRPVAMWPIHPDRVTPKRDLATDRFFYEVDNGVDGKVDIDYRDMFHIRGLGEANPVGVNVMAYAAQSIGWAQAAQLFAAAFFGNGANVTGVVSHKNPLSPEGLLKEKKEFDALYRGVRRSHSTAHIDNDATWTRIGLNARETQLVEVHQFLVEEICRWFGVPPHKVAHLLRATFSNIEHQSIEVVVDSIVPWVKRFEDEADFKLFGEYNRGRYYSKMNLRGLLRGDFKSQNEGLEIMRRNAVITGDEWREFLDMNRGPKNAGLDKYVMQNHNTTLDQIGEATNGKATAPATPVASSPGTEPSYDDAVEDRADLLMSAIEASSGIVDWDALEKEPAYA